MRRGAQCKTVDDVVGFRKMASGGESFVTGPPAFNGQKLKLYQLSCPLYSSARLYNDAVLGGACFSNRIDLPMNDGIFFFSLRDSFGKFGRHRYI